MPTNGKKIRFYFHRVKFPLKSRSLLKLFISKFFKDRKRQIKHLHIIFCTDAFLLTLNKSHLRHDQYTDILTFDLSEESGRQLVAEIYISIDRVKENSRAYETSFRDELLRVIFHGLLHLTGFDDKTTRQQLIMRSWEDKLLTQFHVFEKVPRETSPNNNI